MRGRSSKKHEANEGMELDKLPGVYIRGLVKQLTTSTTRTTKDPMNPKDQGCVVDNVPPHVRNLTKHGRVMDSGQAHQTSTQPQQHKKQVRRRLHTSKPYQERLLNMAEARKEIVTALKFHRASMKQASERQQQQQQQRLQQQQEVQEQQQQITPVSLQPSYQQPSLEEDGRYKSRRNPRTYPSCTTNFPNYMDDFSCSYYSQPPSSVTWPAASPIAPPIVPPLLAENPNFTLPNQPLGLNLNFHGFGNLDATLHLNSSSLSSYSSPASSSPPLSVVTDQEAPSAGMSQGEGSSSLADTIQSSATITHSGDLHAAMDDEGLAEIRSLGEQYQMEWNDTMNLVKSACWFKFLKSMEHEAPGEAKTGGEAYHIFDEVVEFPSWLNANGSCLEQCSVDDFQDSTLPCMDIGDIESMDEGWLA